MIVDRPRCALCTRVLYARGLCRHHYELNRADRLTQATSSLCTCIHPNPRRLDGMWNGLDLYECATCGRKVNTPVR